MKCKLLSLIALSLIVTGITPFVSAQTQAEDDTDDGVELLVPIPEPPKSIARLDERCNYILDHFWDNYNFKNAFSSRKRFDKTFGQYMSFMPYATADTVHMSINRMIKGVEKAKPQYLLDLCEMAEKWTYTDSAEYQSEEIYMPFLEAVATNKKVKGPEKARYEAQYKKLSYSRVGANVGDFAFTCPDGTSKAIKDVETPHILLMFVDPDCIDCRLAKARLDADYVIKAFIDNKLLTIVAIYVGEPTDADWQAEAASMPEHWVVGAAPDADMLFDIKGSPSVYYIDSNHDVKVKNVAVDNILAAFRSLLQQQ